MPSNTYGPAQSPSLCDASQAIAERGTPKSKKRALSFSHVGMVGDIIYALPAIRALGGGTLRIKTHWMREEIAASLLTLLRTQPYLHECAFSNDPSDVDLDEWREHLTPDLTIADMVLRVVGADTRERNRAWLEVSDPLPAPPVLFHRSPRYHNPDFPWRRVWQQYHREAAMVGSKEEHETFCEEIGDIRYIPTRDYLELARVIAGCELFVGNQSSPFSIAEALKKNVVLEVCTWRSDCVFERSNALHVIDNTAILPTL